MMKQNFNIDQEQQVETSTIIQNLNLNIWYRLHNLLLNMPSKKPNLLMGSIYGMTGSAMAWGTHSDGKVYHAEKLKSLVNAEQTNVGILAALLLTISVPVSLGGTTIDVDDAVFNLYYCCWAIASIVLAFAVLISVVANIHATAYETDEELNLLRIEMGLLLHIPLYFLIIGGSLCLGGLLIYLYRYIKLFAFLIITITAISAFALTTYIFILFVQTAWIAFHPIHGKCIHKDSITTTSTATEKNKDTNILKETNIQYNELLKKV